MRIRQRVSQPVADAIPVLLRDVPYPDAALNLFERMTEKGGAELSRLFDRHRSLVHYTFIVFGFSQFLGETLLQNTDLLPTLLRQENLDRSHSTEEFRESFARFRSRSFQTDMAELLARFKRREYIRIMLRDVLGLANLSETTAEISALSDVLIEEAFRECQSAMHGRFGSPQHRDRQGRLVPTPFAVLALGKLGGKELNYSSDIDLMFIYGEGENNSDAVLSNREYFVRLGQQVTNVLSRVTKEGVVFRVDLRLRPQGREGETAISVGHAVRYYTEQAQDWERQAMIKVRYCAGDVTLARTFIRKLQESVYTADVNFPAVETALKTRDRIYDRRRLATARECSVDVKLDRGGIRDIEFLVQCLQRVYGGKEAWLRSGGTLFSLQKLHDKQHIDGSDFHQLTIGYEFLRKVEHRLQLRRGQQTHRIPTDPAEIAILARSLHDETVTPENVVECVIGRMQTISVIYNRIIHHQQQQTEEQVSEEFALRTVDLSYGRVHSDRQILQRLATENPTLHDIAGRRDLEPHTRRNVFRFLSSALTSADRYAAVAAAPELLEKALLLFRDSEFLTDILVRHPEDISLLADLEGTSTRQSEGLFPDGNAGSIGCDVALVSYLANDSISRSEKLALVRRQFRQRTFVSGARDVITARPVLPSLYEMTLVAEEAVSSALAIAQAKGLAVLAVGRLGTGEFDCLSDADLLFVRERIMSAEDAARIAEEVVEILSAYTSEGTVVAVDLRLRPHGNDGELTISPEQLAAYFDREANAWETLTYTKLRHIAGVNALAQKSIDALDSMYRRFSAAPDFARDVREMRLKLEEAGDAMSFKTGRGGLYDIDFLVGYLLVRNRICKIQGTTRERLQKLGHAGVLEDRSVQVLIEALDFWRTIEHVIRLATGKALKSLPVSASASGAVQELMGRMMSPEVAADLDSHVDRTRDVVRQAFENIVR